VPELAAGIVAVSNATMEKALRVISMERGHDTRRFALICFGGGGGLHAADLARSLGFPKVVVPRNPGAFSALGILLSDVVCDSVRSVLLSVPEAERESSQRARKFLHDLENRFAMLERASRAELERDGFSCELAQAERHLDLRYAGQSYELSVPFRTDFRESFRRAHQQAYGYAHPDRAMEIVKLRIRLVIEIPKPIQRPAASKARRVAKPAAATFKPVWFGGKFLRTALHERENLKCGTRFRGPAVIVEYSSTTVVPPDFECYVDEYLNLILRLHSSRSPRREREPFNGRALEL
jgi:N-methylhydantoinase A